MSVWDWLIIGGYLLLMAIGALYLGKGQKSRSDYYLGGNRLPSWTLAASIVATQTSTNSLLGAPAFVGFVVGGGMLWLQYELAVPLAMLVLCFAFLPLRQSGVISIYAYLERRLGLASRLLASGCFLLFRGVATGVTLYGVATVIESIAGISFAAAVAIVMGITIFYDLLGGMRAVVISDVVQVVLLIGAVLLALVWLANPLAIHFGELGERTVTLVNDWGLTTGNNYGFWPMAIGGLFLYVAYYGCDQSQAQRLLSTPNESETQRVLTLNGLIRFPLVFVYCLMGLGLAAYSLEHADFISSLPLTEGGTPNLNLVFPAFVEREFAPGLVGLAIVGLFAAAMSSIDSALNSLSASTVEDFVARFDRLPEGQLFMASKVATFAWGVFAVVLSFQVESIAPTVLEAVNKVGSMANGPLLALFSFALFCPGIGQMAAIAGFIGGIVGNLLVGNWFPDVSWLWWNPIGFATSWLVALVLCRALNGRPQWSVLAWQIPKGLAWRLVAMTGVIFGVCILMQRLGV